MMSTQCSRFVQNAWKKELCSNCFKPREEHVYKEDAFRLNIKRASSNLKTDNLKLQGILRTKPLDEKNAKGKKRKVAFPDSLTEVIGYGGDDFFSEGEEDTNDGLDESLSLDDDLVPDSEEERALGNLTRANTSFNTVTANLTVDIVPNDIKSISAVNNLSKPLAPLMLGRVQRDAEGRKTTLLVSVTPFGGDETQRHNDHRRVNINGFSSSPKCKKNGKIESKNEVIPKSVKKVDIVDNTRDEKQDQQTELEKIVDMPLITSSNLLPSLNKKESTDNSLDISAGNRVEKKLTNICRSPAIKKPENEKPKISVQPFSMENDMAKKCPTTVLEFSNCKIETGGKGIELTLTPLMKCNVEEVAETKKNEENNFSSLATRKIEGQASPVGSSETFNSKMFNFEVSRELAGEPDGRADEEEVVAKPPPALPKSPPPIETRLSLQGQQSVKGSIIHTEPRVSFLHRTMNGNDTKVKPVVPQKPLTLPAKSAISQQVVSPSINSNDDNAKSINVEKMIDKIEQNSGASVSSTSQDHIQSTKNLANEDTKDSKLSPPTPEKRSSITLKLPSTNIPKIEVSDTTNQSKENTCSRVQSNENRDLNSDEENSDVHTTSTPEQMRSTNKRRMAPKPPPNEPALDDLNSTSSLFARNPGANSKSDSPVVREKEKRERASSCSPKFRKTVCEVPDPSTIVSKNPCPETSSRRSISLSQDSLTGSQVEVKEDKKRGKSKFSLKRFLRMGTKKDVDMTSVHASNSKNDDVAVSSQPKPRLEIIHPLELDGAMVQVVGNERTGGEIHTTDGDAQINSIGESPRSPTMSASSTTAVRPGKPPPPPRNQSIEEWSRSSPSTKSTALEITPKTSSKLKSTSNSWQPSTTSDSIYANLAAEDVAGEVRRVLAPSKPQRTASMREQTISEPSLSKQRAATQSQSYETIITAIPTTSPSLITNESHVYECLSSSPECDSNLDLHHGSTSSHSSGKRKSDGTVTESGGTEFKFHHQSFVRSISLPYCGSETESELYSPYGFYTGDEGPEEDQDWKNKEDDLRISRLRNRRGRSIVHRSLEDNYGAVVVANHEALAQVLEQLNQGPQISIGLRGLKNASLRLQEFHLDLNSPVVIGKRIFYSATWNEHNVTLCIAFDLAVHVSRREFYLAPIVEFMDTLTEEILDKSRVFGNKEVEATISVFPRLQVSTIQSFGTMSKDGHEVTMREAFFVLLQFVNALKSLQARGIEESSKNLSNVVLCREDKDAYYRLYLLQGLNIDTNDHEDNVSLCQCAVIALRELFLNSKLPLVHELLIKEKAVSLSQVKSLLEFSLWGPVDLTFNGAREREIILQRWLDLERANVLHALVRTRSPLTVTDEYQLLFLVRTSAKIMCEASILLDEQRDRLARAC